MTPTRLPQSLAVVLALGWTIACAGGHSVRGDGGVDAGDETVDAGETDAGGTDAGCDLLDPNCPCPTNFHRCAGRCHYDFDPDYCGSSCTRCPNDEYTSSTCDGQQCVIECTNGAHQCGDVCELESGNSCGDTCRQCPTAVNGAPACENHQCAISCASGFTTCGDGRCGAAPNGRCSADGDCCRGICDQSASVCCAIPGTQCEQMTDCNGCAGAETMQCQSHKCCIPTPRSCEHDSDCCSGICVNSLGGLLKVCQDHR